MALCVTAGIKNGLYYQQTSALATDTTRKATPDTALIRQRRAQMDSTFHATKAITIDSVRTDTLRTDTLRKKRGGLEKPVDFAAEDSVVYDADTKLAFLFGKAEVKYENMTLDAHLTNHRHNYYHT